MTNNNLQFIPRDTRDHSNESLALRRHLRMKGKSLKRILLDRFINQYGYDKGAVTATAIIDDIILLIETFYRYTDNSFLKQGQLVWHAVPIDEYPKKGKSMAQTKLIPVVIDFVTDGDIEDMKLPLQFREVRMKKVERWTQQVFDQGALLTQLDLAVLLNVNEATAGQYVRDYESIYEHPLPTRGNIQQIGSGQSHKKQIIELYLKGYLTPTICQRTNHSKEAVERYIRDFEAVKLLASKFDDPDMISRIIRLSPAVVKQYIDLLPLDS
jgi:hypothetical protein